MITRAQRLSVLIVDGILSDLSDRKGIKQQFEQIDDEVLDEIRQSLENVVEYQLNGIPELSE